MSDFSQATLQRWKADPVSFIEEAMVNPETSRPFVLLDAERTFLAHAFKTGPDDRLLYPEQVFSAPKKTGKTTFAAMHLLTTTLLYGGRHAEGYTVANDLEQAQGRVYEAARRIIEASPLLRREAKVANDRISFQATGATVTALASHYESAAGGAPTISTFDELWGYSSERARRLWDEMVPVPTRKISCRLVVTHAGFEGESLLLQELYQRGLQQPQIGTDLYAGDGLLMLWSHQPLAPWQTDRWLADMRRSLRPLQFQRMIENRWVGSESSFIDMTAWDPCVDPNLRPLLVDRRLPVWVGLDASTKHDATALVAISYDAVTKQVKLINHKIFTPSVTQPIEFEEMIEGTLLDWRDRYRIKAIAYDPYQLVSVSQRMQREGLPMQELTQTAGNLTGMSSNLYELVNSRNLIVYPDEQIRIAVARCVAIEGVRGWKISKEKTSHHIDVVVALAMAALVCVQAQRKPPQRLRTFSLAWRNPDGSWVPAREIPTTNKEPPPRLRIKTIRLTEAQAPAPRGSH